MTIEEMDKVWEYFASQQKGLPSGISKLVDDCFWGLLDDSSD